MALVVFLRGVNVGGHRTFRPSILAQELSEYGVMNVGAAGTFIVKGSVSRKRFCAVLRDKLPFEAKVIVCDGGDLLSLAAENPFGSEESTREIVRFVCILPEAGSHAVNLPLSLPAEGEWLVRVIAAKGQFVLGTYRRHMKTIGYLDQLDRIFAGAATVRNWNTIQAIVKVLKNS